MMQENCPKIWSR